MTADRVRIGVVVSSAVDGGGEAYLRMLYAGLARRGHEATLIGELPSWSLPCTRSGVTGKWSRHSKLSSAGRLPTDRHNILRTVTAIHDARPFDLFHLQYKREQVLVTSPLARLAPVLWTEHGIFPDSAGAGLLRRLYARSARSVACIACVSESVQMGVDAIVGGEAASRSMVVSNAVDLERHTVPDARTRSTARQRWHVAEDDLVLLTVSRLHQAKGLDLAIAALDSLARNVTLLIAGDGPDRARLEQLAVGRNVVFTGHLLDPRAAFNAADVFVFPSTPAAREGSPTAMLQAAAHGLPIVATRDAGVDQDVIDAGGALVGRDPKALAHAVREQVALRNPSSRRWAERHGIESWITAYENVMRELAPRS